MPIVAWTLREAPVSSGELAETQNMSVDFKWLVLCQPMAAVTKLMIRILFFFTE
jgi:hypothetical protein